MKEELKELYHMQDKLDSLLIQEGDLKYRIVELGIKKAKLENELRLQIRAQIKPEFEYIVQVIAKDLIEVTRRVFNLVDFNYFTVELPFLKEISDRYFRTKGQIYASDPSIRILKEGADIALEEWEDLEKGKVPLNLILEDDWW